VELEALALKEEYLGSQTRLYDLMEAVSDMCPEQSVMHLIQCRQEELQLRSYNRTVENCYLAD
jgi:hypothetical protein